MGKEKDNLIILMYFIFCGALVVLVRTGVEFIHPLVPFGIMIAAQQLYVIPKIIDRYYDLNDWYVGLEKYIPIWNEAQLLDRKYKTIFLVLNVLFILCVGGIFIDTTLVGKFLPQNVAMEFNNTMIYASIASGLVLCIFRGYAYSMLMNEINNINRNFVGHLDTKDKWSFVDGLTYVTYFIPVIRCIGLLYQFEKLVKMTVFNDFRVNSQQAEDFE